MENFKKQLKANVPSALFVLIALFNVWNPFLAVPSLLCAYFLYEKAE